MNLEQVLRNALDNIRSGRLANEAQVKQAVILPILRALGWDDANPREFKSEHSVGTTGGRGSVDYALFRTAPNERPLVFVETKKLGNVSSAGEAQLFGYAFNQGVPFLVLTDGNVWNIYFAMAAGPFEERIVFRAELMQDERLGDYEWFLRRYLEKGNVVSGKARQDAAQDKEREENQLTAHNAIPGCWHGILSEPNSELLEMLARAVENACGIRPDLGDVRAFLRDQRLVAHIAPAIEPSPSPAPLISKTATVNRKPTRIKVIGYAFDGRERNCGNGIRTLVEILTELQSRDHSFMARLAPETIGPKRRLVSQDRGNIYDNPIFKARSGTYRMDGLWQQT